MDISLLHRRQGIIISTIECIDEVGLQNLSTKLIAKREGVSEGALFRHFKTKTEIMLAVLDHFSQFDDAIINSSIKMEFNPVETLKYFVGAFAEYYDNYPAITAIVQVYDSLMCDPALSEKVKEILAKRSGFIIETVKSAQSEGLIRADIDSEIFESLISGGFREICLKWRMCAFDFSLKEKIVLMLDALLDKFE